MTGRSTLAPDATRSALLRSSVFLGFWLVASLGNLAQLPAGILAAAAATWVSFRLLPPASAHISPWHLARFAVRFFRQTAVAGVDVAWRAFHPNLPLQPGFVVFPSELPHGSARTTFLTIASLLPGALPAGPDRSGGLLIHCLDVKQPVVSELTFDEDLFKRALGKGSNE
jgi:multicomponent Na+:H+ antiporter subunit E